MNTKTFIALTFGCAMLVAPACPAAQQTSDQDSVAAAARRAQAEKKTAPKAKLVINDDNLDTLTGVVNVVGQEPAPPDDQAKKPGTDGKAAKGDKAQAKDEAYWREQFADANKKLADDAHELDILQREYNLKQQQYYADPMASLKQEYTRSDLNDTKAKIDDKSALVEQDKASIANLEDELRRAGGDPGWEASPAQPGSTPAAPDSAPQPSQPSSPPQQP